LDTTPKTPEKSKYKITPATKTPDDLPEQIKPSKGSITQRTPDRMTVIEMREMAKQLNIKGYSRMKKAELINALEFKIPKTL